VGSTLVLLDCLSCDKCVPVCPNNANFVLETPPGETACEDVILDGERVARVPGARFKVAKPEQWANFADACNDCGNCDVFCPEDGGPYLMKARFFGSPASFEATQLDGLLVGEQGGAITVRARIEGREYRLEVAGGRARLDDGRLRVTYDAESARVLEAEAVAATGGHGGGRHLLPGSVFLTLRVLTRGALSGRWNPVSAAVAERWPTALAPVGTAKG
jgi:ferredoxin